MQTLRHLTCLSMFDHPANCMRPITYQAQFPEQSYYENVIIGTYNKYAKNTPYHSVLKAKRLNYIQKCTMSCESKIYLLT